MTRAAHPGRFHALILVIVFCLGAFSAANAQKAKDLALTPPMGWNSWNKFACDINEALIRQTADAMVASGMRDAGYVYLNIDDCWHGTRDSLGFIRPDPKRFPTGIKALADYVHARGLKLGIYSDAGNKTCAGREASRGHEYQDALTYAQWGVDYLKYDWCNAEGLNPAGAYTTMRDALHATGRPIVFSICEWGSNKPWTWARDIGHLWRSTTDIFAAFDSVADHGNWKAFGVVQILDAQVPIRSANGPGHWNDPDMLEVGNGLSDSENRAHFSMWCMLSAPLIAGNDIAAMTPDVAKVLLNKDVIAIDQDSLGISAARVLVKDGVETWLKPLKDGDWALAVLNRNKSAREVEVDWKSVSVADSLAQRTAEFVAVPHGIKNLWTGKGMGKTTKSLKAEVPGHDVLLVRLHKL